MNTKKKEYPNGVVIIILLYLAAIVWHLIQVGKLLKIAPNFYENTSFSDWIVSLGIALVFFFGVVSLAFLKEITVKIWLLLIFLSTFAPIYSFFKSYMAINSFLLALINFIVQSGAFFLCVIIYMYVKNLYQKGYFK